MPHPNEWEARYGAKRRQIDRELLAECERTLEAPKMPEDRHLASEDARRPKTPERASTAAERPASLDLAARERIARAFGRDRLLNG